MTGTMYFVASMLAGYLAGGIPFGLLAGKAIKGIDIREYGSGNLGATNVARTLGLPVGVGVMLLDAAKGFLPTFFIPVALAAMNIELGESLGSWLKPAIGFSAIAGHNWPVYLGFKGGKGVATSLGSLLAVAPLAVAVGLPVFILVVAVFRMISLGSVIAALSVIGFTWIFDWDKGWQPEDIFVTLLGLMVLLKHKSNIVRILAGTEARFGDKVSIPGEDKARQENDEGSKNV